VSQCRSVDTNSMDSAVSIKWFGNRGILVHRSYAVILTGGAGLHTMAQVCRFPASRK
jgi:hypothetical protein